MKKLLTFITVIAIIFSFSLPAFAAETTDPGQVIANSINADTVTDNSMAASDAKDDKVSKSEQKSFKGKFTSLFAELSTLRTECRDLWTKIRESNQSIKTDWSHLKTELKAKDKAEAKKILTDLKAKIDPLRTQLKTLDASIKILRDQKKTEWTNFRAAVKVKDEAKASAALNSIIDLKKQIIEKQKELLPLKQQILDTIKA